MGIGSITDYNSLFANYRVPQIPVADVEKIQSNSANAVKNSQQTDIQSDVNDIDLSIEEKSPVRSQNADVRELSLTFNAGEDFGYIGQDSDLGNLDMQKAISDMKRDSILQQYQYFVGTADNLFPQSSNEDGAVFLKF